MSALDFLGLHSDEPFRPLNGMHGYARGWEVRRGGSTLCKVYEGGQGLTDHVVSTGADSPEIAALLRRHDPAHRVSRADVCLDFLDGPQVFGQLRELMYDTLSGTVVLSEFTELGLDQQRSATLYAGAKTSEVRVRLYEKGKQDSDYAPDAVRLEIQSRPKKDRKAYAAQIEPWDYWGLSRWSRGLIQQVTGVAAPAPPPRSERNTDLDGALNACAIQYGGRFLESIAHHHGDLAAFAADLLARVPGVHGD